jgi:hypothetical protein
MFELATCQECCSLDVGTYGEEIRTLIKERQNEFLKKNNVDPKYSAVYFKTENLRYDDIYEAFHINLSCCRIAIYGQMKIHDYRK